MDYTLYNHYNVDSSFQKTPIARLDVETQTWSNAGSLKTGRYGHGVIFAGEKFIVLGGQKSGGFDDGPIKNEVCTLSGTSMTCEESSNSLKSYVNYPELFLVPEDFGKDYSEYSDYSDYSDYSVYSHC